MTTFNYTSANIVTQNIANNFDYLGLILGLVRLPGEPNSCYRKRLWDVYIKRGGANYTGLVNGITRELGLRQYNALTITFTGSDTSTYPRIIVRDTEIEFYSNWDYTSANYSSPTLIGSIDIYTNHGEGYYLADLETTINSSPYNGYFTATLENGADPKALSVSLLPVDTLTFVENESLFPGFRHKLANINILPGSVNFSEQTIDMLLNHVSSEAQVLQEGDYYIDYTNGIIKTYTTMPIDTYCRYAYSELPITLKASPVILHDFGSAYLQDKIFEQETLITGEEINTRLTQEGKDYLAELFDIHQMYWGE